MIGAKVKPVSDGIGGVEVTVIGWSTIDFNQMRERFEDFGLKWPKGDFDKLRKLRNQVEHHHWTEPVTALTEAIASSFPMVVDFFAILGEDPKEELDSAWDAILERRTAFERVQKACLEELDNINWPGTVKRLNRIACNNCGSSLIRQQDPANREPSEFVARCAQCGEEHHRETSIRMVVMASFEVDAYMAAKDGAEPVIYDCPHCLASDVYVFDSETNICYSCGETFGGECIRCGNAVTVENHDWDNEDLCSYCGYVTAKVMDE